MTPVVEPTFRSHWESGIILTHVQHADEVTSCPFGRPPAAPSTRCSPAPHPATAAPGTTRMIGTERFLQIASDRLKSGSASAQWRPCRRHSQVGANLARLSPNSNPPKRPRENETVTNLSLRPAPTSPVCTERQTHRCASRTARCDGPHWPRRDFSSRPVPRTHARREWRRSGELTNPGQTLKTRNPRGRCPWIIGKSRPAISCFRMRAAGRGYRASTSNPMAILLFCLEKRAGVISCMSNVVILFAKPCASLSSSAVRVLLLGSSPFRVLLPDRGRRGRLADLYVDE
jgi:hypothetical protein